MYVFCFTDNARVKISRLPIPKDIAKVKIKSEHVIEYITPDGEPNEVELFSERDLRDIKQSPHSSEAEEDEDWEMGALTEEEDRG